MKRPIRSVFRRNGQARKFFRGFILFFLLPFVIICVLILTNMFSTFAQLASQEQLAASINALDHLQSWFQNIERIETQIIGDNSFKPEMLTYFSEQHILQKKLTLLSASQNGLENVWFYINAEERFISGNDSLTQYRLDNSRFQLVSNENDPFADLPIYDQLMDGHILTVIDRYSGHDYLLIPSHFQVTEGMTSMRKMIFFQIKLEQIQNELAGLLGSDAGMVRLRSQDGRILLQINQNYDGEFACCAPCAMDVKGQYQTLTAMPQARLWQAQTLSSSAASESWAIDLMITSNLLARFQVTQTTFLLLFLVFLLGCCVCLLLAVRAFRPIVSLREALSEATPGRLDETADDYDYIESSIEQIRADNKQLFLQINTHQEQMKSFIASQLFSGRITDLKELKTVYGFCDDVPDSDQYLIAAFYGTDADFERIVKVLREKNIVFYYLTSGDSKTLLIFGLDHWEAYFPPKRYSVCLGSGAFRRMPVNSAKAWLAASLDASLFDDTLYEKAITACCESQLVTESAMKRGSLCELRAYGRLIPREKMYLSVVSFAACVLQYLEKQDAVQIDDATLFFIRPQEGMAAWQHAWENLCNLLEALIPTVEKENSGTLEQIYQYIARNYDTPSFSIKQIASDFSMSISSLSSYFKNHTGLLLSDYITEMKMKKAMHLLKASNLTIQEIALSVGYYNVNSFVRRFRQITDQTPTEYRAAQK